CPVTDMPQWLQRANTMAVNAFARKQAIHEQQAPAIRQGIVNRARELPLMLREALPEFWPLYRQRIRGKLQAFSQGFITVFKANGWPPSGRGLQQPAPQPMLAPAVIKHLHLFNHTFSLVCAGGFWHVLSAAYRQGFEP